MIRIIIFFLCLPIMASANMTMQKGEEEGPLNQTLPTEQVSPKKATLTKANKDEQTFSSLAFGNGTNSKTSLDTNNIHLNQHKNFGTIINKEESPFGASLFNNQCAQLTHMHYLNPDYRIAIGDKINVQIWGAFQYSQVMVVDTQGNIFLPEVGPVKLAGIANKNLNALLRRNLKRVFLKDVHIYGDLITAQPVQVYVTGFVNAPGLYNGLSSDSIIYYLCHAAGINNKEGSFRNIKVIREGKTIERIDLYQFLMAGKVSNFQLHQGDTVFVGPLRRSVSVEGNVKSPYQYELRGHDVSMRTLMNEAHLDANVTHLRVDSHQGKLPEVNYLSLEEAKKHRAKAGDHLVFISDQSQKQVVVTVKGETIGQHQFVLKKGASLESLLTKLTFTNEADLNNVQLFRQTAAEQQKTALESSLARLERQMLTTNSVTAEGAKLQAFQTQLLEKFVAQAKKVSFEGQVILGPKKQWAKLHLENDDVINIPRETAIITVSGDVMNSISLEAVDNGTVRGYISEAGGFSGTAEKRKILLVHQNGRSQLLSERYFNSPNIAKPGDQIIVLAKPQSENWQVAESLTQVMYRIAVAARVAVLI